MEKPTSGLDFKSQSEFEKWLKEQGEEDQGYFIFLYKKKYSDKGLTYDEALESALCYGWIDAVTYSYDDVKFLQYFSPRRKTSNWSLRNIIFMKDLIEKEKVTERGLRYFDLKLLDQIDQMVAEKEAFESNSFQIDPYIESVFLEESVMDLFNKETASAQKRYISYIREAKQEKTRIRRCHKIAGILKGEKNNL